MPDAENPVVPDSHTETARSLTRSTLALHVNTLVTSLLGFAFLIIAARLYDRAELGRDTALVSAMSLLGAIAELNARMAIVRFLPRLGARSSKVVLKVFVYTAMLAAVLSTLFVIIAPRVSQEFNYIEDDRGLGVAFVLAVVSWAAYVIGDAVLTAVRATTWVPVKNATFGLLKLAIMAALAGTAIENGVFLGWAIGAVVLTFPSIALTFRGPLRRHEARETLNDPDYDPSVDDDVLKSKKGLIRYLGYDYLAAVMSQVATSMLPLVVVATLGSTANAEFAVAFAIVIAIEQLALNAGIALTVEGSFDARVFAHLVRHSFLRFGGLLAGLVLIGIVCAPIATALYGNQYGQETTDILRILLIGLIPEAIVILYEAVARVQGKTERVAMTNGTQAVVIIGLAVILAEPMGLTGIGIAWIVGHSVAALAVLPSLLRLMFPREPKSATVAS